MNADKKVFYTEVAKSLKFDGYKWQQIVCALYDKALLRGDNSVGLVTEISEILTLIGLKTSPDAARYWVNKVGFVSARICGMPEDWSPMPNSVLEKALHQKL